MIYGSLKKAEPSEISFPEENLTVRIVSNLEWSSLGKIRSQRSCGPPLVFTVQNAFHSTRA